MSINRSWDFISDSSAQQRKKAPIQTTHWQSTETPTLSHKLPPHFEMLHNRKPHIDLAQFSKSKANTPADILRAKAF